MNTKFFIAVCAFALCVAPALSQPDASPKPKEDVKSAVAEDGSRHEGPGGIPDDELREMVSTILMVRVSRDLDLTDEQTVILVKHMQEMRDELSKLYEERDVAMKALRDLVANDSATDDAINAKLQELISLEEKRAGAKRVAFEKLSAGLTTKQKGKLFVTLQDFEMQMRKMMSRAKDMGEDAIRERFKNWERGEGHGPMDRPMVREFMKNRKGPEDGGDAPKPENESKPETPQAEKPAK
ncbi:MAG: hypothetical protein IT366_16930 [Candidatus Hydrogenedentes bacterium]|nr:hypothetical protein [Candidatus Hydrogenedentota bacterium]